MRCMVALIKEVKHHRSKKMHVMFLSLLRLPVCLMAVLPRFRNAFIPLLIEIECGQMHVSNIQTEEENFQLGNTGGKQPGSLKCSEIW